MSLSRPERLRVLIARNGLHVLSDSPTTLAVDLSIGILEEALAAVFAQMLADIRPRSVELLLSSGLVDTVVLPALTHWLTESDLVALGRTKLAAFYGTEQSGREIVIRRESYGMPTLAQSAAGSLLIRLRAECKKAGVKLIGPRSIASLAIERLEKILRHAKSAALWVEDADSAWLGIFAEGKWRSARCIPASLYRQSLRQDVLQRECLAVGLAGVEKVFCVSAAVEQASDWGNCATDVSDRLSSPMRQASSPIDFGKKPAPRLGWSIFCAAWLGVAATGYAWLHLQTAYDAASDALVQRRQMVLQEIEEKRGRDEAVQADFARALAAYRLQRRPWGELFTALNDSGGEAVGLIGFRADALDGTLTFDGEAKRFEDVQGFADALGRQPQVRGVKIATMMPGDEASAGRIKFSLSATWNVVSPKEASLP